MDILHSARFDYGGLFFEYYGALRYGTRCTQFLNGTEIHCTPMYGICARKAHGGKSSVVCYVLHGLDGIAGYWSNAICYDIDLHYAPEPKMRGTKTLK